MKLHINRLAIAVGASLLCAALPAFAGEFRTTAKPIDGQYIVVLKPQAASLAGFITRIGSGDGIGLADEGHMLTVSRPDIVSIPLRDESASLTTFVLYRRAKKPLPLALRRFIAHVKAGQNPA